MFDFFKYVADEIAGIDTDAIRKAEIEKKEEEKKNRIIFSKKAKVIVYIAAISYILIGIATLVAIKGIASIPLILSFVLRMMIALGVIISLIIGKKKGEIIAIIGIVIFFLLMFLSTAFV